MNNQFEDDGLYNTCSFTLFQINILKQTVDIDG